MYNTTAFLYESIAAFEDPNQVCEILQALLADYGLTPPGVLGDLGSGTGLMSVPFAEQGWRVEGIELSDAMIAVAEAKARKLPGQIRERLCWRQGDISNFALQQEHVWDAAVCLCNTINHLSEWHLVQGLIQSVSRALKSGGVLILDTDTLDTFKTYFNHGPVVVWDDGTHRLTRVCEFSAATSRANHVAILEQYTPDGLQVLSQESMILRYHPETDLFIAFEQAGFQLVKGLPFNPFPSLYQNQEYAPKLLWVLQKS